MLFPPDAYSERIFLPDLLRVLVISGTRHECPSMLEELVLFYFWIVSVIVVFLFDYLFSQWIVKYVLKFFRISKSITHTCNLPLYCMYCKRSGFRIQPMVEAVVVLVCRYTRTLLHHLVKFLLRVYVLCYIEIFENKKKLFNIGLAQWK